MSAADERPGIYAIAEEVFAERIPFNHVLGLHVESIEAERASVRFMMRDELIGNFERRILHGGVIASALDVTGGLVAFVTVMPSGIPSMGRPLATWFVFCLVMGVFVAYLTGLTLAPGTDYMRVFRIASTVAFLGYAGSAATESIWKGQPWSTTFKNIFDGLVYSLVTAGFFGWLWPS